MPRPCCPTRMPKPISTTTIGSTDRGTTSATTGARTAPTKITRRAPSVASLTAGSLRGRHHEGALIRRERSGDRSHDLHHDDGDVVARQARLEVDHRVGDPTG